VTYPRDNNFDLLRIILAYTVVIYHSGYLTAWLSFRYLERPMIDLGHRLSRE
jgi:peptidoglycan/LPS O-acetylase OafA/YrhL